MMLVFLGLEPHLACESDPKEAGHAPLLPKSLGSPDRAIIKVGDDVHEISCLQRPVGRYTCFELAPLVI